MKNYRSSLAVFVAQSLALSVFLSGCSAADGEGGEIPASSEPLTGGEALLERSIAFHDPDGVWSEKTISLSWNGTDGDGGERVALDMTIEPDGSTFAMTGRYRGRTLDYSVAADRMSISVDGSTDIAPETSEELRLSREDGLFWRSYFGFLVGLPMKLRDPGTRIDPDVIDTRFMDRAVQAIRVTYDPDVGADIWYFYFDPDTAELVGCRFYHDESVNDGEFLVFEDVAVAGRLRLPMRRGWFVNADSTFLGQDEVSGLAVSP